jgi:hypothetical protein
VVPGGEILQRWFGEAPVLILMDEVLNFIRRTRDAGGDYARLGSQMYSFLEVLSREAAGTSRAVLVVALPMSEYEMTREDEAEFQRLNKALDRLSKPALLSEGTEIAEIVRRRLFEEVGDPEEIRRTARAYAEWLRRAPAADPGMVPGGPGRSAVHGYVSLPSHGALCVRAQVAVPPAVPANPGHPAPAGAVGLPRLPAGLSGGEPGAAHHPGLGASGGPGFPRRRLRAVGGGTAGGGHPLGHRRRGGPRGATGRRGGGEPPQGAPSPEGGGHVVFFESSGGQLRNEATLPEIRLAVGEPGLDIGNIETALEDLVRSCYYLHPGGRPTGSATGPT